MDLYREIILDHYRNPRNFGELEHPDRTAMLYNTSCGDRIRMDIKVGSDNIVDRVSFSGEGCAISVASASMLTEMTVGKKLDEIAAWKPDVVYEALGTTLTPARVKCALLPLEVLQKAASGK